MAFGGRLYQPPASGTSNWRFGRRMYWGPRHGPLSFGPRSSDRGGRPWRRRRYGGTADADWRDWGDRARGIGVAPRPDGRGARGGWAAARRRRRRGGAELGPVEGSRGRRRAARRGRSPRRREHRRRALERGAQGAHPGQPGGGHRRAVPGAGRPRSSPRGARLRVRRRLLRRPRRRAARRVVAGGERVPRRRVPGVGGRRGARARRRHPRGPSAHRHRAHPGRRRAGPDAAAVQDGGGRGHRVGPAVHELDRPRRPDGRHPARGPSPTGWRVR